MVENLLDSVERLANLPSPEPEAFPNPEPEAFPNP
jgi:hypothetical protein